jgi:uncharacterized Ntn-hydrolase superfamily protein
MGARGLALSALLLAACATALIALPAPQGAAERPPEPRRAMVAASPVATFSIVARDAETGDLGVAVQSRFFAVGAVVPWARAGVGAIATQSWANTSYGPRGLDLMATGKGAEETLAELLSQDEGAGQRQVGIVGADGTTASHTGDDCLVWAGSRKGDGFTVQGNILAGPEVVDAMAAAFEGAEGDLAARLVHALAAGQAAGGDARGRQSAALLVVREGGGYGGFNDRYIDLRVDDHATPIVELRRLLEYRHGQIATGTALRHLRAGDHAAAALDAERAVQLLPQEGSAWLALARARLAGGATDAAAAAAAEALVRDPWVKTAVVRGILRLPELEQLLQVEAFARLWSSIPAER